MKEKTLALPLISHKTLTIILSTISFVIPFSLGQPQILVGSLVNAAIIMSAVYLPSNLALPVIILPSLAVLLRGLIFGPFTYFLVIFLPAIWVGNWLLFIIMKKCHSGDFAAGEDSRIRWRFWSSPSNALRASQNDKVNYFISLFIAALIKSLFLYSFALILVNLKIAPKLFLTTMGLTQFLTAASGGLMFFLIKKGIINE